MSSPATPACRWVAIPPALPPAAPPNPMGLLTFNVRKLDDGRYRAYAARPGLLVEANQAELLDDGLRMAVLEYFDEGKAPPVVLLQFDPLGALNQRLDYLAGIGDDWDAAGAYAPDETVVANMRALLAELEARLPDAITWLHPTDLSPTPYGTLTAVWETQHALEHRYLGREVNLHVGSTTWSCSAQDGAGEELQDWFWPWPSAEGLEATEIALQAYLDDAGNFFSKKIQHLVIA